MFSIFKRRPAVSIKEDLTVRLIAERDFHIAKIEQLDAIISDTTERRDDHMAAYEVLNETLFQIGAIKEPPRLRLSELVKSEAFAAYAPVADRLQVATDAVDKLSDDWLDEQLTEAFEVADGGAIISPRFNEDAVKGGHGTFARDPGKSVEITFDDDWPEPRMTRDHFPPKVHGVDADAIKAQ